MIAKLSTALFIALLTVTPVKAQSPTPTGFWQDSSGRVQVEIKPCGELLCGKIVWFKWPDNDQGLPLLDVKNTDPALRTRPLLGLTILYGLRRTGENTWVDGQIYNPEDGVNYQADMSIEGDGSLNVRASQGPFGKTLIWTRMTGRGGQPSAQPSAQPSTERPPGNSG
jgi:uncharacterized protein (DUF2147 family)